MSVTIVYVDCLQGGQLLKTYEFGLPIGLVPGIPASDQKLERQAKDNLTSEGIAFPPYKGVTFNVRRS